MNMLKFLTVVAAVVAVAAAQREDGDDVLEQDLTRCVRRSSGRGEVQGEFVCVGAVSLFILARLG